jgi:5'-nucleotidase
MLRIGITSRALFDLDSSHSIFENEGLEAYKDHQILKENIPLKPGQAFLLVKKLLNLNKQFKKEKLVEVILLSRNTADTGLRVFNSIEHHDLDIKKAAFCGGNSPHVYAKSFGAHLFLSTEFQDCKSSIENGIASARIIPSKRSFLETDDLRVAFDGDSVIFSEESQKIFDERGLKAFDKNEKDLANKPLSGGSFKSFLDELYKVQQSFPKTECPIRIALVTARSAPSHERVIKTLREWNIRVDESLFLGGMEKTSFLKNFGADIFFDDQLENCKSASLEVPTGQVINFNTRNYA